MKIAKKKRKSIVLTRTQIPPHWDYSNKEGRAWMLEDGNKVSKGEFKNHIVDTDKYEVRRFVHKFEDYSLSVLRNGLSISKSLIHKVESSPSFYYTITPKNYLYDDLGVLDQSILWDKPEFSYIDIFTLFASEIKTFLAEDPHNICLIEKKVLKEQTLAGRTLQYKEESFSSTYKQCWGERDSGCAT